MAKVIKYAKVVKKVADAVKENALFTAYEITEALGVENPTQSFDVVRVRETVKELLDKGYLGNYKRTKVDFIEPPFCGQVGVYHPADVNPTEYPLAVKEVAVEIKKCPHCGTDVE